MNQWPFPKTMSLIKTNILLNEWKKKIQKHDYLFIFRNIYVTHKLVEVDEIDFFLIHGSNNGTLFIQLLSLIFVYPLHNILYNGYLMLLTLYIFDLKLKYTI